MILIKLTIFIPLDFFWSLYKILRYRKSVVKCQKKKKWAFNTLAKENINVCDNIFILSPFHSVACTLSWKSFNCVLFSLAYFQISLPFLMLFSCYPLKKMNLMWRFRECLLKNKPHASGRVNLFDFLFYLPSLPSTVKVLMSH